jgi:hypothetical protein
MLIDHCLFKEEALASVKNNTFARDIYYQSPNYCFFFQKFLFNYSYRYLPTTDGIEMHLLASQKL